MDFELKKGDRYLMLASLYFYISPARAFNMGSQKISSSLTLFKKTIKIVLLLLICSGCSSSLKKSCELTNWKQMGISDGKKGKDTSEFTHKAKMCYEYDVLVNMDAYYQGREEGLTFYCTPLRGLTMGQANLKYRDICPPDERKKRFLLGYMLGREIYNNKQREKHIQNEILKLEKEVFQTSKDTIKNTTMKDPATRQQIEELQKKRELILDKLISLQNTKNTQIH